LKVTLKGIRPPIWRRIQLGGDTALHDLHRVLQVVMGWEDCHVYQFIIAGTLFAEPEDCGGPWGYADLLDALQNPDEPARRQRLLWLGTDLDPEALDIDAVNQQLQQMR